MALRCLALALLLAAGLVMGGRTASGATASVELSIEAPERYAGLARRLERTGAGELATVAELAGIERPGPPVRVLLAPEGSPLARAVPPWVAGYADGGSGTVVLMPARTPTYPDSSIDELLRHEVAHVLVARAAGGRPLPRWFQEGVATVAGSSWGIDDRSYLAVALLGGGEVSLPELERQFSAGEGSARRAYAVAGAFVREVIQDHGPAVIGRILAGVARERSFEEAFAEAAGEPLGSAAAKFWQSQSFWYRWMPLLTSSVTLWLGITLLALLAIRRRRARDAALRRQWEEEERQEAEREARRLAEMPGEDRWGPS